MTLVSDDQKTCIWCRTGTMCLQQPFLFKMILTLYSVSVDYGNAERYRAICAKHGFNFTHLPQLPSFDTLNSAIAGTQQENI